MEKILFYIHSLNKGGAERVLITIADELTKDYEVVLVTDCIDDSEYKSPNGVQRIVINELLDESNRKINYISRMEMLRSICKEQKPICIVAFMLSSSMRCILANMFSKCRVISTIRSDPFESYGKFYRRAYVNMVFSFSKAIVCQTSFQQNFFWKPIRKKSTVILNPVFKDFCFESFVGERTNRIVATGRLVDFKNYELMVEGFAAIADEYPNINLEIFGEGPYRKVIENVIHEFKMEERVLLKGDSVDVANDIRDALFYVMTTNSEGMPNSLMEAMALGLPVLSTDCLGDGAKTLIRDGYNGLLIPTKDKQALVDGYRRMLDNKELRDELGMHAREIQDRCDVKRIASEWEALWK